VRWIHGVLVYTSGGDNVWHRLILQPGKIIRNRKL
jgi:hypothetical protein